MIKYKFASLLLFALCMVSCSDVWDTHYSRSTVTKSNLNLYEYLQSKSDLSIFAQMVKISGYDTIISRPQTYTVWAPLNSALSAVNLLDTVAVSQIVKNHISRFSYPELGTDSKIIYMLGKKFVEFKGSATGYTFGGKALVDSISNVATSNGILHCLDGYVPYVKNIWEYIGTTPGLDSLRNFLYSKNTFAFDQDASVEIGTDSLRRPVYDSVINFSNPILSKIGNLHIEDSVFTALLPNNTAWTKAYNRIKSNYKTLGTDGAAIQRYNTQMAIVQDLIFKKPVADPNALDSLVSTTGSKFKNPSRLFVGANKTDVSNGYVYTTDSIRFTAAESYQKSIKVEAENSAYGRNFLYASLAVLSSKGSAFSDSVSASKYLVVYPTTVSNNTFNRVTFPLPNVLSGKYNIYCVFVPNTITDNPTDIRRNKVKFYLNHLNSTGKQAADSMVTATNVLANAGAGIFTTKPGMMTKMFVTQYNFPYCNLYDEKSTTASITNRLRVENAVKITETVTFNQVMRIDYIILEPVQ